MEKKRMTLVILLLIAVFGTTQVCAQFGDRILINGYSSFEFEKQFGDEGKGDPNASFDADLFDLVLNVYATNRLRVAADFSWEHGTATEDGRGNAVVEYAFGEYTVTEQFRLRAGKMFTHFGIYNEIHTAKPAFLTVKEPLSTNKNEKFGSDIRFYPRWATGIAALGNVAVGESDLDYIVQITNGEQELQDLTNPFEEDDNTGKAISGRVRFSPSRSLQIGASFHTDGFTELDSLGEDSGERTSILSYGAHVEFNADVFGVEAEVVSGSIEPSFADKRSRMGYTAMVYAPIQEIVTPYLRYEFLDPDKDVDDDTASMFVYGLNFQVDDGLFVKVELNSVSSGDNNGRFNGKSYTELKAAVAIGF